MGRAFAFHGAQRKTSFMLTAIWVVLAAAGWGSAGQAPASETRPAETQPARYVVPADRPWWEREGLVIASVGESLSDRAWRATSGRTRVPTYNERDAQKRERSEASLSGLKALGVNLVLVPYGGFGPDAGEQEERQLARETIATCHKVGLKCGVWIPVGQVDAAVWKSDGKDVSDWLVLMQSGKPLAAPFAGRVFTSDAVGEVRARARRLAGEIGKLDADAMFVPEWRVSAGFEAAARDGFGEYLKGQTGVDLELFGRSGIPADGASPLMRAWVSYRAKLLSDALHEMADELRKSRSGMYVAVDCGNPSRQIGVPAGPAVDPAELLRGLDGVFTTARPETTERGEIRNQVADLKLARSVGVNCIPRQDVKLALAQQLAFGGDSGGVLIYFEGGNLSGDDASRVGIERFAVEAAGRYRARRELYAGMRPVADVLLWRPRDARLYLGAAAEVEQIRATDALVTHRIPFGYLFAESPGDVRDAALVVAGIPAIAESAASDLRRFVSGGGAVVVVGASGVVDSAGKVVGRNLAEYLTETSSAPAAAQGADGHPAVLVRKFGDGRVVSISQPGAPLNIHMSRRRSSKGRNAPALEGDDLAAAIRAALGRGLSVEAKLQRGSAVELTRSDDGRRAVLHVVNFNPDGPLAAETAHVRVKDAGSVTGVWRYEIGKDVYEPANFKRGAGEIAIEMKPVELYDAYLIEQK